MKKEKKGQDEPKKITKLAIGKEGGADSEQDEWDIFTKVFCQSCKKEIHAQNVSKRFTSELTC